MHFRFLVFKTNNMSSSFFGNTKYRKITFNIVNLLFIELKFNMTEY